MTNQKFFFSSLLLSLCTISYSADVFVSIDCGSSASSFRDVNGIVWTGDDPFLWNGTGESRSVAASSSSVFPVMNTLRVFTTGKKNCYHIDNIKQGKVLVRASFYYGNYDGRSSPPSFDLLYDGNYWASVETTNSGGVRYEVTYVMKRTWIDVCVAMSNPGEFPFVSAIEVRGLEIYSYSGQDVNYPMFLSSRIAFGTNSTIRFQNDPYDRIWSPDTRNVGFGRLSGNASFAEVSYLNDRPPPAVLRNAITTSSPNQSLVLSMGFPPFEVPVYINWYFSEIAPLPPNQIRSFTILLNGNHSDPILPPYQNCSEMFITNIAFSSKTNVSLVPTNVSTLPPLINAMEVFFVGDELNNGTDLKDVKGLTSLQEAFGVLQGWSGDPCFPVNYSWDWIQCTPRVTSLLLGSFELSGLLPNFSSMDALQTIDLHNNNIEGPIPEFLGTLPNLKILNLSNNKLNGSVPASLATKKGLTLLVSGNPDLCTSNTCPSSKNTSWSSSIIKKRDIRELLFSIIFSTIILCMIVR